MTQIGLDGTDAHRAPALRISCWSTGFSLPRWREQQAKACTPAVRAQTLLKHEGTESKNVATFPQRPRHETTEPTPAFDLFSRGTRDERLQESLSHDNVTLGVDEIADLQFNTAVSLIRTIVMRVKPLATPKLGYTAYQARTQWYMNQWGPPAFVRNALMEDGHTKVGIMAFVPSREGGSWWTIATNGMSERQMPCIEHPHGDPRHRLELITYARESADWICELLIEMARYPFEHRSGLAVGHTLQVTAKLRDFWSGYLILSPKLEPSEFNPLAIEVGIGDDWIFFAEVMGLKADELLYAIDNDGPTFTEAFVTDEAETLLIDIDRASVLDGNTL